MPDILFILILALVIFGPKRLPEIARQIAKYMSQFRVMRDDLKRQLESELLKIELEEKQKATVPPSKQLEASNPPTHSETIQEGSITQSPVPNP
jgi:sec-independent protein translocase protein TatB